jgi:hypothetical protein
MERPLDEVALLQEIDGIDDGWAEWGHRVASAGWVEASWV